MIKQRRRDREPWPFGVDDPAARARVVAHFAWSALREIDPGRADEVLGFFAQFGEDYYLAPTWQTTSTRARMTRLQVAELAHVGTTAVANWGIRGIVRAGHTYHLRAGPDGLYDPDDVTAYLQVRATTEPPTTPGAPTEGATR